MRMRIKRIGAFIALGEPTTLFQEQCLRCGQLTNFGGDDDDKCYPDCGCPLSS